MSKEGNFPIDIQDMKPTDYILVSTEQDKQAPYRWNVARYIRKKKGSSKDKLRQYLSHNVGDLISGEELRYLANNNSNWTKWVNELITENGYPIVTKTTGNLELPVGTYRLESLPQSVEHDKLIACYL